MPRLIRSFRLPVCGVRHLWASVVLLALSALLAPAAASQEWPQWRGPEGLGVAAGAAGLPEEWGPESAHLRWRTVIPGEGSSSPIVSGGRVFVTSALEGQGGTASLALRTVLLLVALWVAWVAWRGSAVAGRALRLVSVAFAGLAVLSVLQPDLFLEAGNPGRTWRALATLALVGLGAALFWLRAASRGRLLGAAALLLVSAYLAVQIPSGPRGGPPLEKAIAVVLPGVVAAAWGLWSYRRARAGLTRSGADDSKTALGLLALAALVFVPPNYWTGLQRTVACVDLASGDLLWQKAVFRAPPEQKSPWGSYATPTAAADGERLFVYFGLGLAALDYEGRVLWTREFGDYGGHSRYGAATSPVLVGDTVVLLKESELYQAGPPTWMAAFDKETGEVRWRVEPADAHDSYATPLLLEDGTGRRLVTDSWELLIGFDADSGERLWSHPYPMQQLVSSLAREGDLVAVTGGNHGEKALMAFRLPPPGSAEGPELLWESRRGVATVVSPVLYDGILFTVNRSGIMTAYGGDTGDVLWKRRLDGEYFASLVAGDGKVYVTNTEGTTTVLAATAEQREIAVNDLPDGVYASPAIADGGLLLRSGAELFFIEGGAGR